MERSALQSNGLRAGNATGRMKYRLPVSKLALMVCRYSVAAACDPARSVAWLDSWGFHMASVIYSAALFR